MKIAQLRRDRGLTQTELAERCDTTQQQIARIESGAVDPRLSTIRRIANALGCEPGDLFFTRAEFLAAVREVAARHRGDASGIPPLLELNSWCSREKQIPSFDPFWEELVYDGDQIVFHKEV